MLTANRSLRPLLALALLVTLAAAPTLPARAANVVIVSPDFGTGLGFDDPTPVAPVGGNPGVTLGQQRVNAVVAAAGHWANALDSDVDIVVFSTFTPLFCSPTSAALASASTNFILNNFPGAAFADTWYHQALADKLAGFELLPPGFPFNIDIVTFFNSSLDNNPACLGASNFYYGLDNVSGPDVDFQNVAAHEIAHGLGFSNFVNEVTGTLASGLPDIYAIHTEDNSNGLTWDVMTDAQRVASAVNDGNVVWNGASVTAQAASFLGPRPALTVNAPAGIAGSYTVQTATFGPALTLAGTTGDVELADDGTGVATDACEALNNSFNGRIALIDRGVCGFVQKVANAEAAGAGGVIIANNVAPGLPGMGGADPGIGIPSVGISLADGNAIKAELGVGVNATLGLDGSALAGADDNGRVRLYAPPAVSLGSSISHWDTAAEPSLLMEPFITGALAVTQTLDLTPYQLEDIGWCFLDSDGDGFPNIEDACPASDLAPTVVIDGCDSGVANTLLGDGCTITDLVAQCAAGASNHGGFVSCAAHLTNALENGGVISGSEKGGIMSCAGQANIP